MDKKWEDEITYEANLGIILKKKIRISPAGIEWEGQLWTLDSITRIGFCIFSHSVNYIPVGTNYTVSFGTRSKRLSIDLRKKNIYLNFVECLWKAVGVRILNEYLDGLRNRQQYEFSSVIVRHDGIYFKKKLSEDIILLWHELVIQNESGGFSIWEKSQINTWGFKTHEEFSYIQDNVPVLEALFRTFGVEYV
ncbi:MAG: hypothetical protein LBB91_05210 [Clostridiales bacterium]|jgi:hypothetical protein|nr:hypothetical protein [Clostridiales bacterium]